MPFFTNWMEILGKILGSIARVKIMRLFLLNKGKAFTGKDIAKKSRLSAVVVRREINILKSIDFIKKRANSYVFNSAFKYTKELEGLLITVDNLNKDTILRSFRKVGRIKLLIVSGIFIKNENSRVDLLIVGNKMKKRQIEEGIRKLEAEIGTELIYATFDTKEFIYRIDIYDKLVRDILDFPHEVILQTKELSTQILKKA